MKTLLKGENKMKTLKALFLVHNPTKLTGKSQIS